MGIKDTLSENVFSPARQLYNKYIGRSPVKTRCNGLADFIYNHSKETAVIMLLFNSISIISSHLSQIGGLKKSKRENKNYLINQEYKELGLDCLLTVIPPFLLNHYLMKKFDSGEWTTRHTRDILQREIMPAVGVTRNDIYNTDHIKPIKETLTSTGVQILSFLKKKDYIPKKAQNKLSSLQDFLIKKLPDPDSKVPIGNMIDITTDFDQIFEKRPSLKNIADKYYNKSAYSEVYGQRTGLIVLSTIAYLIVASNVIMPILKNKLANKSYEKELADSGETPESIARKKRFNFSKNIAVEEPKSRIFNSIEHKRTNEEFKQLFNKPAEFQKENIFDKFEKYNKYQSQSFGMKI